MYARLALCDDVAPRLQKITVSDGPYNRGSPFAVTLWVGEAGLSLQLSGTESYLFYPITFDIIFTMKKIVLLLVGQDYKGIVIQDGKKIIVK